MDSGFEKLVDLCREGMSRKNIVGKKYQDRIKQEIEEIRIQNMCEYVVSLSEEMRSKKQIYPINEPNLLTHYLLDISVEPDLSKPPLFEEGEFPDIDIDYLGQVRDYLKHEWAPKTFGRDFVCSIGNYTTFGIKSAFIDIAKLFGNDRDEILSLTTKLGLKDEDGKTLTFDKALEEYPELKKYCDLHPEVGEAVQRMIHRNRGMGVHAGGLIISNRRIDDLVPIVKGKDDTPVSAWSEGLQAQHLGPMGLIKFDLLVITNLLQIAYCTKLVKERHGLEYLCSDPAVNRDWSDTAYLNDPKAIALANEGDLLGIFQFDSPGIRKLTKGNTNRFDDLMAYSALYRPGPLDMGMEERYIARMHGKEEYELHPLLQPILDDTYGVMVYQEQVMQILNVVGDIPLKDCESIRKAISKKEVHKFERYQEMFLVNGQKILGWSESQVDELWKQIESFAAYGFNKSHSCAYTYISLRLLYLKAHYPIEFFTATLHCEKDSQKIKEYISDAKRRGLKVLPVDLNKSKYNFSIGKVDENEEAIYFGFSKLIGLGEEISHKIVQGQPYDSFEDFLQKFGTDAKVLNALISLSIFGIDRVGQYKFYTHYKDWSKKIAGRDKRFEQAKERHKNKLMECINSGYPHDLGDLPIDFSDESYQIYEKHLPDDAVKELEKIRKSYLRCVENHTKKSQADTLPRYCDFNPDLHPIEEKWDQILSSSIEQAEEAYYGFRWTHPLEMSPDYDPDKKLTFYAHRALAEEGARNNYVEVYIHSVDKRPTKKGGVYYQLTVSDALDEKNRVNVWQDDYDRFEKELVADNMVKLRLDPPDNGFPTYKLTSPPRHLRWKLPEKTMDFRVVVLRNPGEKY